MQQTDPSFSFILQHCLTHCQQQPPRQISKATSPALPPLVNLLHQAAQSGHIMPDVRFPLQAQHMLSISLFVRGNKELFTFNSQVHNCNTRFIHDLHYPRATIGKFQKGICYIGAKAFNHLPTKIRYMSNDLKNFKVQPTTFLMQNSFYTNNELFRTKYA
jgi:hypothetical protein